ncbi:MAG: acylphosphatase [Candidatus Omnitrophota bacterium]
MTKRIHLFYSGRVQGVGFRYTVQGVAYDLEVVGWIKNLYDGRVEVVAEAEESALKKFLSYVRQHFQDYIKNTDVQWQNATGEFEDFRITF